MLEKYSISQLLQIRGKCLAELYHGNYPFESEEELLAARSLYESMREIRNRKHSEELTAKELAGMTPFQLIETRQKALERSITLGICLANLPLDFPERESIADRLHKTHERIEVISVEMKKRRETAIAQETIL